MRVRITMFALGVGCWLGPPAVCEAPPDSDGDGLSDLEDQCPQTWGRRASPFGAGCPMAQDANGNWCGPDEHSVNGVCVPVEDTTVTEPPPPAPDATDEFCSNPGNWSHPTCGGSSGNDGDNDGGAGGGGGGGDAGGGDDDGDGDDDATTPLDDDPKKMMERVKNCGAPTVRKYWDHSLLVSVNYGRLPPAKPAAAGCGPKGNNPPNEIRLLFDRNQLIEGGMTWHWASISTIHEFVHVGDYIEYDSCAPWLTSRGEEDLEAAGFDATRDGMHDWVYQRAHAEFLDTFGVRAPGDPDYDPIEDNKTLSCLFD